jgi:hypothetical protein
MTLWLRQGQLYCLPYCSTFCVLQVTFKKELFDSLALLTRLHCTLCILFSDVKGNKKLADGPTRGSKKKRTDIPIIVHSYTTIMVHIAFTGGKTNNLSCR